MIDWVWSIASPCRAPAVIVGVLPSVVNNTNNKTAPSIRGYNGIARSCCLQPAGKLRDIYFKALSGVTVTSRQGHKMPMRWTCFPICQLIKPAQVARCVIRAETRDDVMRLAFRLREDEIGFLPTLPVSHNERGQSADE